MQRSKVPFFSDLLFVLAFVGFVLGSLYVLTATALDYLKNHA